MAKLKKSCLYYSRKTVSHSYNRWWLRVTKKQFLCACLVKNTNRNEMVREYAVRLYSLAFQLDINNAFLRGI